jgi:LacI family transcriptional regulator
LDIGIPFFGTEAMEKPRRIGVALEFYLLYKHHTEVFAGFQRYADERGWVTVFDDWIAESLASSPPGSPAYDGVVARVDHQHIGLIDATARAGVPLVNVLASSPARDQLPGAFADYAQAGRLRAEHMMSRGLRNFACASIKNRLAYHAQATTFAATVAAEGCSITRLDLSENWGETHALYRQNRSRIQIWIESWELPIGVATSTDVFARELAQMCRERGLRIPEDVAIVGGMNEEQLCENPRPTLSSVEMGFEQVGHAAAKLLESLMDEADQTRALGKAEPATAEHDALPAKPVHIFLPPVGVVVRESTDFFATDDELVAKAQAFIAEQCHTHLDVEDVAAKLCVSSRTLQKRFAAALGRTVAQEIRRVRVEKVKRELTGTDRPIHAIAQRAGFTSNARLCEAFRRDVGMSPRDYRKQRTSPKG